MVMVTGPIAILSTAGFTVAAADHAISDAVAGLLVALTVLIHTIVAERTRRQAKVVRDKVRPQVTRNAEGVEELQTKVRELQVLADERGRAIERMDRRISRDLHGKVDKK